MSPSSLLSSLLRRERPAGERSARATAATMVAAVAAPMSEEIPSVEATGEGVGDDGGVARTIDVSRLPPPLPMVRILETLRDLGPGETLLVRHAQRPIHLYPRLDALGCSHETVEHGPEQFEISITKPTG